MKPSPTSPAHTTARSCASAGDAARAVFRLDGPEGPRAAVRAVRADAELDALYDL